MNSPRRRTTFSASSKFKAPAATSALYSPSEWPATKSAFAPRASSGRSAAIEVARIAGCVLQSAATLLPALQSRASTDSCQARCRLFQKLLRAAGNRLSKRLSHPHLLRALSRKYKCRLHTVMVSRQWFIISIKMTTDLHELLDVRRGWPSTAAPTRCSSILR